MAKKASPHAWLAAAAHRGSSVVVCIVECVLSARPVSSARSWTCSAPPSNRDFAIYKAYDDVEGSTDLANPKTSQPGHDGVNVTPVINDKSDMEAANIQAVAATPGRVPHERLLPPRPRRRSPNGYGTFPHMAPLTAFVKRLRTQRGGESVPSSDLSDAGVAAKVLLLFEALGPLAVGSDSPRPHAKGSGIMSRHNSGGTAATTHELRFQAGLAAEDGSGVCLHGNIVPGTSGTAARPARSTTGPHRGAAGAAEAPSRPGMT